MQFPVMLCKDYEEHRVQKDSLWSAKIDGVRGYYIPGENYILSRSFKPLRGLDHIIQACDDLTSRNHWLDMELHVPGLEFNATSGIVRNHDDTPQVEGAIFDVPDNPGIFRDRVDLMNLMRREIAESSPIKVLKNQAFSREHLEQYMALVLNFRYEGIVIKSPNHLYRNSRSYDWMREVPIKSYDCRCTGVYEGKGKMEGIAGGIYITFQDIEHCKVGSMKGLDYAARGELLANANDYIGRSCVVEYKNLQPSGKPRQPRFKGWRYDK